jgi:hypothetical protein
MPRVIKPNHTLVCSHGVGKHGPYTFCTGTRATKRQDHRSGLAKQGKTKKVKTPTPASRSRTPESAKRYSPSPVRAKTPTPTPKPRTPRRMTLRNRPRVDYAKLHKHGRD